jgi:hypothetical protein
MTNVCITNALPMAIGTACGWQAFAWYLSQAGAEDFFHFTGDVCKKLYTEQRRFYACNR